MKPIRIAFLVLLCMLDICQAQEKDIILQLTSVSQPLDLEEPDFSGLEPVLNNKKIIALGEATHGTKEFEELFSHLIQFNIEKLGCTAVAFEGDFLLVSRLTIILQGKSIT